jgi:hypothetical protein
MKRDKTRQKQHRCSVCGSYGSTHIHHIFGGRFRTISEKNGFVIELCPKCHEKAHKDNEFAETLKRDCELDYVWRYSLQDWMELMGKNWLRGDETVTVNRTNIHKEGPLTAADFEDVEEVRRVM